jgi:hypothetical protein
VRLLDAEHSDDVGRGGGGGRRLRLSPAIKRRAGIELRPRVDADADAAVSMVGRYKQVLKSV